MINKTKTYKVSTSVYPTNRIIAKRARDSSGCIPPYNNPNNFNFISFSIKKSKKLKW